MSPAVAVWGIAAAATGAVIVRPWRIPEPVWAVAGAAALVLSGLLPVGAAWRGVAAGTDVYLFLTGMMLLAEVARQQGLFDWLAAHAAALARGSARRLFTLVYVVGTAVTVFMSNDATAVVLTPAVAAVTRAVKAEQPLPYLLVCAFIANAASFVLPISNPANLVIYGSRMPPLPQWLSTYAFPSLLSIVATYVALRLTQRRALLQPVAVQVAMPALTRAGRAAAAGIVATAVALMAVSALDWQLGLPTCLAGLATLVPVALLGRSSLWSVLRNVSWGVLPLVAGLFVMVEAVDGTGIIGMLAEALRSSMERSPDGAAWGSGVLVGLACNVMNNLPAGLIVAHAVQAAPGTPQLTAAALIGIDLGPNLTVTGSLATLLWLAALRREGLQVGAALFFRLGLVVMPPALVLALAALLYIG